MLPSIHSECLRLIHQERIEAAQSRHPGCADSGWLCRGLTQGCPSNGSALAIDPRTPNKRGDLP
jgi:hypothetical protein